MLNSANNNAADQSVKVSFFMLFFSYCIWGVYPLYFYFLREVSAFEILAHRLVWSALLLIGIDYWLKPKVRWYNLIKQKREVLISFATAIFLTINWLVFIWAVGNGLALEASLGYFINPLVSVLLAMLFLGERTTKLKLLSILIAVIGVLYLIIAAGIFPWVALALASCFGMYGLLRKLYKIDAFAGLTLETVILAPFACLYLLYLQSQGDLQFLHLGWEIDIALLLAGAVTASPLLLFLSALPNLSLMTVGLTQYVAPTMQFFVAIYLLHEPFNQDKMVAFLIIWSGLALYSYEEIRRYRQRRNLSRQQHSAAK